MRANHRTEVLVALQRHFTLSTPKEVTAEPSALMIRTSLSLPENVPEEAMRGLPSNVVRPRMLGYTSTLDSTSLAFER